MKRTFTLISIMALALTGMSCSKELNSPEDLADNTDNVAKVSIWTKGENSENTVTMFRDANVYRKSDYEGQGSLSFIQATAMHGHTNTKVPSHLQPREKTMQSSISTRFFSNVITENTLSTAIWNALFWKNMYQP